MLVVSIRVSQIWQNSSVFCFLQVIRVSKKWALGIFLVESEVSASWIENKIQVRFPWAKTLILLLLHYTRNSYRNI